MIAKMHKIKSWFFEKINKIDKPSDSSKTRGEKTQKSIKLEVKKEKLQQKCRNTKDHKRLLRATLCQ